MLRSEGLTGRVFVVHIGRIENGVPFVPRQAVETGIAGIKFSANLSAAVFILAE